MKNYEVELKYTSYITTSVQADTEDEAVDLAWSELFAGGLADRGGQPAQEPVAWMFQSGDKAGWRDEVQFVKPPNHPAFRNVVALYTTPPAQPAQEPVGKFAKFTDGIWREVTDGSAGVPLYTPPPQRPWVDLTSKQLNEIFEVAMTGEGAVNLALEKIKELNHD